MNDYDKTHTEIAIERPNGKPWTFSVHNDMVNLVNTMNNYPGVYVTHSYSGEADRPVQLTLWITSLEGLPHLLYWCQASHSGVNWKVSVATDCWASNIICTLKSINVGPEALAECDTMAEAMKNEDAFDSEMLINHGEWQCEKCFTEREETVNEQE